MIITKIEVQKKNKNRFSLYSEDVFLFGVCDDTLVHFHIQKDKNYSDAALQEILDYENKMQCRAQAYRYLSRRPHLAKELSRKLMQKGYEAETIEAVIKLLKQNKYLDDSDFIRRFISDEIRFKRNGPLLIKKKLFQKGAAPAEVERCLQETYPEKIQLENAMFLYLKKKGAAAIPDTKKLGAYLQQKGFHWEIITTVIKSES